jgi:transcriptional regulator with XRE-family HTH domain
MQFDGATLAGTVHSPAYAAFLTALVRARTDAELSQAALAARLGKPASFVGKYELGERRLDVIEVMVILRALDLDFARFWQDAAVDLPDQL